MESNSNGTLSRSLPPQSSTMKKRNDIVMTCTHHRCSFEHAVEMSWPLGNFGIRYPLVAEVVLQDLDSGWIQPWNPPCRSPPRIRASSSSRQVPRHPRIVLATLYGVLEKKKTIFVQFLFFDTVTWLYCNHLIIPWKIVCVDKTRYFRIVTELDLFPVA